MGGMRYRVMVLLVMRDRIYGDDHLKIQILGVLECKLEPKLIRGGLDVNAGRKVGRVAYEQ